MGIREFTKSGTFVLVLLVLTLIGVPFGIEQIGEATGLFEFPVVKTVTGWFPKAASASRGTVVKTVDWEPYRRDLEKFTVWAEGRDPVAIALQTNVIEVITLAEEERPKRRIWSVPVTSCTSGGLSGRRRGYAFIAGFDHPFEEGAVIRPSAELCGYEIAFVGDRAVWFRAIFESEGDNPMGHVKLPEFKRVGNDGLVIGSRKYVARDAFPLESGGWLTIDSFLPPDGVLFKLLDENRNEVAAILCIVIGERGGRR